MLVNQTNKKTFVSSQDEEEEFKESQPVNYGHKKMVVIHDDQWMDYDDPIEDDIDSAERLPAKIIVQNQYLKVFKERV